jgi:hypothetical protein
VFVIGSDKKIKPMIVYLMSTGRNFDEILRVIDSLQLTARYSVATPVNWKDGDDSRRSATSRRRRSFPAAGKPSSLTYASSRSRNGSWPASRACILPAPAK